MISRSRDEAFPVVRELLKIARTRRSSSAQTSCSARLSRTSSCRPWPTLRDRQKSPTTRNWAGVRPFRRPRSIVYPRASGSFVEDACAAPWRSTRSPRGLLRDHGGWCRVSSSRFGSGHRRDVCLLVIAPARGAQRAEVRHPGDRPTLLGALESVKSKIDINIGVLKEKSVAAQKRRNEVAVRQIEKAVNVFSRTAASRNARSTPLLHEQVRAGADQMAHRGTRHHGIPAPGAHAVTRVPPPKRRTHPREVGFLSAVIPDEASVPAGPCVCRTGRDRGPAAGERSLLRLGLGTGWSFRRTALRLSLYRPGRPDR